MTHLLFRLPPNLMPAVKAKVGVLLSNVKLEAPISPARILHFRRFTQIQGFPTIAIVGCNFLLLLQHFHKKREVMVFLHYLRLILFN